MAKNITPRNVDYSKWYTDVIIQSKMADYSPVKGSMVIRPNGYAIWEMIQKYLSGLPGVVDVHDLHIWAMSSTEIALTAHLIKPNHENDDELIRQATEYLHNEFGIGHITIQWERR